MGKVWSTFQILDRKTFDETRLCMFCEPEEVDGILTKHGMSRDTVTCYKYNPNDEVIRDLKNSGITTIFDKSVEDYAFNSNCVEILKDYLKKTNQNIRIKSREVSYKVKMPKVYTFEGIKDAALSSSKKNKDRQFNLTHVAFEFEGREPIHLVVKAKNFNMAIYQAANYVLQRTNMSTEIFNKNIKDICTRQTSEHFTKVLSKSIPVIVLDNML